MSCSTIRDFIKKGVLNSEKKLARREPRNNEESNGTAQRLRKQNTKNETHGSLKHTPLTE